MKNIKKGKEIKRVSDKDAAQAVNEGWKYCPNREWRQYRNAKSEDDMFKSPKKKVTKSKKKKLARKSS
tara:strand:+ start:280 stop:483 length:204 start_codon:yes stop_codon:yes gene_type:complete